MGPNKGPASAFFLTSLIGTVGHSRKISLMLKLVAEGSSSNLRSKTSGHREQGVQRFGQ